ncbi:hypothetical protein MJD09_03015, partial [bacterium]|nr:hypothetical protein [bacterium]
MKCPLAKFLLLACLLIFGLPEFTRAQISLADSSARTDTSKVRTPSPPDSTKAKAISSQPLSTPSRRIEPAQTGLDSAVTYQARDVHIDLQKNVTQFIGDAEVKYKNYIMKAGKITVRWDESLL